MAVFLVFCKERKASMAKVYCPTKGKYVLPKSAYMRTVYTVRDYPRLLQLANDLVVSTSNTTSIPKIQKQRNIKTEEHQSLKYAEIMNDIRLIEEALLESVSPDDREAVLANVINDKPWPHLKSTRTYRTYKQKFLYTVAKKFNII